MQYKQYKSLSVFPPKPATFPQLLCQVSSVCQTTGLWLLRHSGLNPGGTHSDSENKMEDSMYFCWQCCCQSCKVGWTGSKTTSRHLWNVIFQLILHSNIGLSFSIYLMSLSCCLLLLIWGRHSGAVVICSFHQEKYWILSFPCIDRRRMVSCMTGGNFHKAAA